MLFSDGHKASWPTSKKNRHLLLAVASSCRHVITSDQSSYFLVGHVELVAVCKYTIQTFSFISQLLHIVGGSFLVISFIIYHELFCKIFILTG